MDFILVAIDLPPEDTFVNRFVKTNNFLNNRISSIFNNYGDKVLLKVKFNHLNGKLLEDDNSNFEDVFERSIILRETSNFLYNKEYYKLDDKSKHESDQVIANIIYYLNIHKLIYNPFANKIFTDSKDSGSTNIKKNQIGEIEQIVKLIEYYNDKNLTPSKILYGNREEHSINFSNVVNHKILFKSILEKLIKMYISNSSYEYMVDNDGVLLISFAKNELPKDELPINEVHNDESSKVEKDKVLDYMFTYHCKRILENTLLIEYNIINTTSALENDINFEFADAYFPMLLRIMNEERGDGKTSKLKIELKSWIFPMYQCTSSN